MKEIAAVEDVACRPEDHALAFRTLTDISKLLDDRAITSRALCGLMLERVRELNPSVGSYSDVMAMRALEEAVASDGRRRAGTVLGPLDGVPVAVKDLIETTPAVCKSGLDYLGAYRPARDAAVVMRLRAAGAVIIGVTETDAGAFGTSTPAVINPLAPERIAGGSSGGSAATLAAGLAYGAIGSDTGGSIRIPSACCSTSGFKPTWGRVSVEGVRGLAPSLDHVGPMARCVADLSLLQAVLDLGLMGTRFERERLLRVGVSKGYFADAEPMVASAMASLLGRLAEAGVDVHEAAIPTPGELMKVQLVNALKEMAEFQTHHFGDRWKDYPEVARLTMEAGLKVSAEDYAVAERQRLQLRRDVEKVFETVDLLILPTLPMDAPFRDGHEIMLAGKAHSLLAATVRYTALFNQTGHPVVAMPGHAMANGRTIGIQVVGKLNSDADLLADAEQLERVLGISVDYGTIIKYRRGQVLRTRTSIKQGRLP
jgi:Asp-tRNA(Asn)/Glu-tRNA(Gln) amidotransferase A subunit family amidase